MSEEELQRLSERGSDLEFDAQSLKTLKSAIPDLIESFWAQLPQTKAYTVNKEESKKVFSLGIGPSPHPLDAILRVVSRGVIAPGVASASARHLGNIPGGGIPSAALADFLAAATNKHAGILTASPGAANVETAVLEWTAGLFGFDKDKFGGCLTSGGSMATVCALAAARDAKGLKARDYEKHVIYAATTAHFCIEKGLRFLGLHECAFRQIAIDDAQRISTTALEKQLMKDIEDGLTPFVIIGCLGTTSSGALDDLSLLSALCHRFGAWFHVDAAYGGFFLLLDEIKEKAAGIENADSIVVDPHKGLFLPFGTGMLLVKNVNHLLQTHCFRADYIDYAEDDRELGQSQRHWAPADVSPELTRDFRGLRVWLPLLYHGTDIFRDTLQEKLLLARYLYSKLGTMEGVEVGPPPHLSIVLFRFVEDESRSTGRATSEEEEEDEARRIRTNQVNKSVVSGVLEEGSVYLTTIEVSGVAWIRLAILSFRTHRQDVDLALQLLLNARNRIIQEHHASL